MQNCGIPNHSVRRCDKRPRDRRSARRRGDAKDAILWHRPQMSADQPKTRPLERFWPYADLPEQATDAAPVARFCPYADLPEQPTEEELASLDPDLHEALFGARPRPFSITLVFPPLETPEFARALDMARGSAEFRETGHGDDRRYRARFWSSDAARL